MNSLNETLNDPYTKNWPMKCPLSDDLMWAYNVGLTYLRKIAPKYASNGRTGVVIFDLDDTLFMSDMVTIEEGSLGMRADPKHGGKDCEIFFLPPNKQIVQLAIEAKKLGFKIMCLTARPAESYLASMYNLDMLRIPYDFLVMNEKDEDPYFKLKYRIQMSKQKNCDIVLTVGDQFTDLLLCNGTTGMIKLPEEDLKCSYAYFPPI
jgi:hypothetical protein